MIALLRIKTSVRVLKKLTGPVFTAVLPADLGAPRLLGPFFASSSILMTRQFYKAHGKISNGRLNRC